MTRARERLLLSGAADFARWPAARQASTPIAWLAPALVGRAPGAAGGDQRRPGACSIGDGAGSTRVRRALPPATVGTVLRLDERRWPVPRR